MKMKHILLNLLRVRAVATKRLLRTATVYTPLMRPTFLVNIGWWCRQYYTIIEVFFVLVSIGCGCIFGF
jgi:hypothetical protein